MTVEHEWPFERPGDDRVRPWFLAATGYLFAVFPDPEAARRAERGLVKGGVSEADVRINTAEQILSREAARSHESSNLTKALTTLTVDSDVYHAVMDAASTGGSMLWAYAPTDEDANRMIRLLADHGYVLLRYYGHDGTVNILPYAG